MPIWLALALLFMQIIVWGIYFHALYKLNKSIDERSEIIKHL